MSQVVRPSLRPLPLALALVVVRPEWWPVGLAAVALRLFSVWATAKYVLRDPLTHHLWPLLPLQDALSFAVWICGFFGRTIQWRGRKYYLLPDGRCKLVES